MNWHFICILNTWILYVQRASVLLQSLDGSSICDSSLDQSGLSMDTSTMSSDYNRDPVILNIDGKLLTYPYLLRAIPELITCRGRAAPELFFYAWWFNLYWFFMDGCLFRKKYFVHGGYFPRIYKIRWVFPENK